MKGKDLTYHFRIAALVSAYIRGSLTAEERVRLQEWTERSEENRLLLERICDKKLQEKEIAKILSYNTGLAWVKVQHKIGRRRQKRIGWVLKIAASVVLLVGLTALIRFKIVRQEKIAGEKIAPGHYQARLTFASGKSFYLDSLSDIQLFEETTVVSTQVKDTAGYTSCLIRMNVPSRYNTLQIPRGGEYKIMLADGTEVWLNSATEFRFPENFDGRQERVVYLSGEAFFKVKRNESQPFVVKCNGYDVKVLGTSFNISSYEEDGIDRTTLAEGKVEIIRTGERIPLEPGEQACIRKEKLTVEKVKLENYITWMNPYFRFEGENIDRILSRLARWYDVEIFYLHPSVKIYHFTGYLPRYANISEVLELLSMTTNIKFEVKGRTVVVVKK